MRPKQNKYIKIIINYQFNIFELILIIHIYKIKIVQSPQTQSMLNIKNNVTSKIIGLAQKIIKQLAKYPQLQIQNAQNEENGAGEKHNSRYREITQMIYRYLNNQIIFSGLPFQLSVAIKLFLKEVIYAIKNSNNLQLIIQSIKKKNEKLQKCINRCFQFSGSKSKKYEQYFIQILQQNKEIKQIILEFKKINFQKNRCIKQLTSDQNEVVKILKMNCPGCIRYLQQNNIFYWKQNRVNNQQVLTMGAQISSLILQKQSQRTEFQYNICKILNGGRSGYLFLGVDLCDNQRKMQIVKGIKILMSEKEIQDKLKSYVSKYIVPQMIVKNSETKQQISILRLMQINLIPVYKKQVCQMKNYEQNPKSTNVCVVRIKIDLRNLKCNKLFHVRTPTLNNQYKYMFYEWRCKGKIIFSPQLRLPYEHIYSSCMKKHYQKQIKIFKQYHSQFPKCDQPQQIIYQVKQINKAVEKQNSQSKYGQKPNKLYHQQSLLLVSQNAEQNRAQFEQMLKGRKIEYKLTEIYQKAKPQKFQRSAYYITHQKKYNQMQKIATEVNKNKNQFILLDIRQRIMLLHQQTYDNAIRNLFTPFYIQFHKHLNYGECKAKNTDKNNYQCFFEFQNTYQTTFAFVILQYNGIRCNFVNKKKTQDVGFETITNYQQFLSKIAKKRKYI